MVVRFDFEDSSKAVADVHGAGVLARTLQHALARCRQRLEVNARALVAAVLRPHHGEDAELGHGRLAPEHLDNALIFVAGESVAFENLIVDGHRESVEVMLTRAHVHQETEAVWRSGRHGSPDRARSLWGTASSRSWRPAVLDGHRSAVRPPESGFGFL